MNGDPVRHYLVTLELPARTVDVYAKDGPDAVFRAYHMIGLAGVKAFGRVAAVEVPPPASPAVTHTGPQ